MIRDLGKFKDVKGLVVGIDVYISMIREEVLKWYIYIERGLGFFR